MVYIQFYHAKFKSENRFKIYSVFHLIFAFYPQLWDIYKEYHVKILFLQAFAMPYFYAKLVSYNTIYPENISRAFKWV